MSRQWFKDKAAENRAQRYIDALPPYDNAPENEVYLQYWDGKEWVPAGGPFYSIEIAFYSLGNDNKNYRIKPPEATGE